MASAMRTFRKVSAQPDFLAHPLEVRGETWLPRHDPAGACPGIAQTEPKPALLTETLFREQGRRQENAGLAETRAKVEHYARSMQTG